MKKLFLFLLLTGLMTFSLFASITSFIVLSDPYGSEESVFLHMEDEPFKKEPYKFIGNVSSDCVSIRVIWSDKSIESIMEYLLNKEAPAHTKIDDYTLQRFKPGDSSFEYNAGSKLENIHWGSNYYVFIAKFKDNTYKLVKFELYVETGGYAEKGKPVIYLYPEKEQTVKVQVKPAGGVTVSIPEYKKGWKVKASPDGKITDLATKQEYPYLFWESKDVNTEIDLSKGFVTPVKDLEKFFTEKLTALGLNQNEINDFNEFWIPSIQKEGKPYVFITFYNQDRIDAEAPLFISPKPDSVIRVYFDHKSLDKPIKVEPQELTANERKGFAVVEWGGRLYK